MIKLTRKDLRRWERYAKEMNLKIKKGYCCHYESNDKNNLIQLGFNDGVYGWNWSLYIDNECLYIDGYRNY